MKDEFNELREEIAEIIQEIKDSQEGMLNATLHLSQKVQLMASILQMPQYVDTYSSNFGGTAQGAYREVYGNMYSKYFEDMLRANNHLKQKLDKMQELYDHLADVHAESKAIMREEEI